MQNLPKECAVCAEPAQKSCSGCNAVAYCCIEHQKNDWKSHKSDCSPYIIKEIDELGRCLVASRDLKPGTIVLSEDAVSYGPNLDACEGLTNLDIGGRNSLPICLSCLRIMVAHSTNRCRKCNWPVCSVLCENAKIHKGNECNHFSSNNIEFSNSSSYDSFWIIILRLILLKTQKPEVWLKLMDLQSNFSINVSQEYVASEQLTADLGMAAFKMKNLCTIDEWKKAGRILTINSFNVNMTLFDRTTAGNCLYLKTSMFSHSCAPNCSYGISIPPDCSMQVHTAVQIKKGSLLTIGYYAMSSHRGTSTRRKEMEDGAKFLCCCARCKDPTEMDSHLSTLICDKCGKFTVMSENPLDEDSEWKCVQCDFTISANSMTSKIRKYTDELQGIIGNSENVSVGKLRKFLSKYSNIELHRNHYILFECAREISKYYCRNQSPKGGTSDWKFHIELMQYMLGILDFILPGLSLERAQLQRTIGSDLFENILSMEENNKIRDSDILWVSEDLKRISILEKAALKFYSLDISERIDKNKPNQYVDQINTELGLVNQMIERYKFN